MRGRGGRPGGGRRGGHPSGARANPGRVAAARALVAVEEGKNAEDALAERLPDGPDGRLAYNDVFGVLRRRGEVDAALRPHLRQPLAALDAPVRAVLRLGAYEKLFSRAPDHAVVQQWVEVSRRVGAGRASGLVNAILRRVQPGGLTDADRLNHPAWLFARWSEQHGEEAARAWCDKNNTQPPLTLVTHDIAALEDRLGPGEPAAVGELAVQGTRVAASSELSAVEEGLAWVQDPAAVVVADRFAAAVGEGRVLDATASPGGKALRLWSHGLQVVATDLEARLGRLQENVDRMEASVEVQPVDWTSEEVPDALGTFDGVLLDAPCTGLGTVRRHPEIRWRRKPTDPAQAAERQLALLHAVAARVGPGGVLGYAVCSGEPEEGSEVVAKFLARAPEFDEESRWDSVPPAGEEDAHQLFVLRRR